jgi:Tfp pilus assembly protein PilE
MVYCLERSRSVWQSYQQLAYIAVRLYKDIVLSRCKAYNVTALVHFTCTVMEKHYVRRLRSFANSREVAPRNLLQALLKKAEYLNTDNITRVTAFTYLLAVPSEGEMKNMKLTFQWVFACVKQVNTASSTNIRRKF